MDIAEEHQSKECIKILTEHIKKISQKNSKTNGTIYENRISISSDESMLSLDYDQSYSNIKTSTFDESHLEFHLKDENLNRKKTLLKNIENQQDLEKLISNIIDLKLESKQLNSSPNMDSTIRSSPFVNQNRGRTATPKSNSSTQTKITGKRFLSPDKLPAYLTPKKETPKKSALVASAPPAPPPLPPVPTIAEYKPSTSRETQTTGKMLRLKAVPVAPPDLMEELQSKLSQKFSSTNSPNKFKNFLSKFSTEVSSSLKPSDFKFKKLLKNSPDLKSNSVTNLNKENSPAKKDLKLRQRSSSLIDSQRIYSNEDVKQKVMRQKMHTQINGRVYQRANEDYLVGQANQSETSLITNDMTFKNSSFSFKTAEDGHESDISLCKEIQLELNKTQRRQYESMGYSDELIDELINKMNLTSGSDVIEANMFNCFEAKFDQNNELIEPRCEWREGNVKSAFNYLLIDPRLSQNLPKRAKFLSEKETFKIFVSSIFYIGKGSRARPYAHLYDTLKHWKKLNNLKVDGDEPNNSKISKKMKRIIEIWDDNKGIVSLHCFQSVIPSEAYTREAAMIDALGLHQLTNMKKGNYYGQAKDWTQVKKKQLGVVLLKRACAIFLAEGERQITPIDI